MQSMPNVEFAVFMSNIITIAQCIIWTIIMFCCFRLWNIKKTKNNSDAKDDKGDIIDEFKGAIDDFKNDIDDIFKK